METTKTLRYRVLRLDGDDYFAEKIDRFRVALSKYAPNLVRGRAEILDLDDLSEYDEYDEVRDWITA